MSGSNGSGAPSGETTGAAAHAEGRGATDATRANASMDSPGSGWMRDMLKGLVYALLIIASILFFSGTASRFIYVDF